MSEYEIHPLAKLAPPLTDQERIELIEDVRANGLRVPIRLYDGKVLDGRHRLEACRVAGVEVRVSEYSGDDPAREAWSLNTIKGRTWTDHAKVQYHDALFKPTRGPANSGSKDPQPSGRRDASERTGVSETNVKRSRDVSGRVERGDAPPELGEAVYEGDVTLFDATQKVVRDAPPEVVKEAVEAKQEGHATTLADYIASSAKDDWETPAAVFDPLHRLFRFTVDGAATEANKRLDRFWPDAFAQSWEGERVFVNPPYGRQQTRWIEEAAKREAALSVLLIPARTDTAAWHDLIFPCAEVWFLRGRVRFGGPSDAGAPFPSAVVVFRPGDAARGCVRKAGTLEDLVDIRGYAYRHGEPQ